MGRVTVVIALLLSLLTFLNHPHGHPLGKLRSTAMQRAVVLLETQTDAIDLDVNVRFDRSGANA